MGNQLDLSQLDALE